MSILAEGIDRFIREAPDGRFLRADRPLATLPDMSTERFPIRVGKRSRLLLRIGFGVTPDNAWVDVGDAPDGEIHVSFGRFHFRAFVANVTRWRIEGPWAWITAIGVRMSIRHRDVSFCGSAHGAVRMDLKERVRWGPINVPAVWAGADDLDVLATALARLGIPGEDVRRA